MLTVNSLQLSAEFQHEINPNLKKIELHSDVTESKRYKMVEFAHVAELWRGV